MTDLTDAVAFPLNSTSLLPSAKIIDDERFEKCAILTKGETLSFGYPKDIGLDSTDFTCSIWLKKTAPESVFNFLQAFGWHVESNGLLSIIGSESSYTIENQQWLHITFIKQGIDLTLYINGTQVDKAQPPSWRADINYKKTCAVTYDGIIYTNKWVANANEEAPSVATTTANAYTWHGWVDGGSDNEVSVDNLKVSINCTAGEIYLANQNFYSRALSQAEILQDFYQNVKSVEEAKPETDPLSVRIINPGNGDWSNFENNLMIVDAINGPVQQAIEIKNANDEPIQLKALNSAPASKENFNFEIRFQNLTFSDSQIEPKLNVEFTNSEEKGDIEFQNIDEWNFSSPTRNDEDASWSIFFASKKEVEINQDSSINFVFEYSSAKKGEGARETQFALYYKNIESSTGKIIQGDIIKRADIRNNSSNNSAFKDISKRVITANENVEKIEKKLKYITTLGSLNTKKNEAITLLEDKLNEIDQKTVNDIEKDKQKEDAIKKALNNTENTQQDIDEDAIKLLADHAIALNAEVDIRAKLNNERFNSLLNVYPLSVSCTTPNGAFTNQDPSTIEITVHNHTDQKVIFNQGIVVKIPILKASSDNYKNSLSNSDEKSGANADIDYPRKKANSTDITHSPGSYTFKRTDTQKIYLDNNESLTITIPEIKINDIAGTCFVEVKFSNVENVRDKSFLLPVTKTACDLVPLGTVMEWWRPNAGTKLPQGWAIADGSKLCKGHDVAYDPIFEGKTLPNLIDKFVRGASESDVEDNGGHTKGGEDKHNHHSSFDTGFAGAHNHNWCWYEGKKMKTYDINGSRWTVQSWGNGIGDEGDGMWGLLGDDPFDGYTDDERSHKHSVDGWTDWKDNIPEYVGLLKLIRVL